MRWKFLATSPSMPGRMRSRYSTTVTSEPRRRHTEPSSRPITPAPMTTRRFGTLSSSSAPVEDTTTFSSISTPGRRVTSEPVAMTMFFVSSTWFEPSSAVTSTWPAAAMRAVPKKASILFFLSRNSTPLTLPSTPSCLKDCIVLRSSVGARNTDAEAGEMIARLLEHVRGMQQRLRRNAADIEAGAAMGLALLDDGGLEAELRCPDGADIAAGTGADDDEIVGHWLSPLRRHART